MPAFVTACTGLDALSHAIEGYWSKNHQPICDALACEAAALVFRHLPAVLTDPNNLESRAGMSLAALMGGMAFQLPKNAAVHACSFPLSSRYHLPHGAACAMMLDRFIRFNAEPLGERGVRLARATGHADMQELADAVLDLKQAVGLPVKLSDAGVTESDLDELVASSFHPLMNNNPKPVTPAELRTLYTAIL
jgi:alcohol dehydrogenase